MYSDNYNDTLRLKKREMGRCANPKYRRKKDEEICNHSLTDLHLWKICNLRLIFTMVYSLFTDLWIYVNSKHAYLRNLAPANSLGLRTLILRATQSSVKDISTDLSFPAKEWNSLCDWFGPLNLFNDQIIQLLQTGTTSSKVLKWTDKEFQNFKIYGGNCLIKTLMK